MTGAPAPTSDHHPMAFTRSDSGNACIISAIEVGIVADPARAPSARSPMIEAALQANAVSPDTTAKAAKPIK